MNVLTFRTTCRPKQRPGFEPGGCRYRAGKLEENAALSSSHSGDRLGALSDYRLLYGTEEARRSKPDAEDGTTHLY